MIINRLLRDLLLFTSRSSFSETFCIRVRFIILQPSVAVAAGRSESCKLRTKIGVGLQCETSGTFVGPDLTKTGFDISTYVPTHMVFVPHFIRLRRVTLYL